MPVGVRSSSVETKISSASLETLEAAKAADGDAAPQEELVGLAKWQAEHQKLSTKIWQPLDRCKRLIARICEDPYCIRFAFLLLVVFLIASS